MAVKLGIWKKQAGRTIFQFYGFLPYTKTVGKNRIESIVEQGEMARLVFQKEGCGA